MSRAALMEMGPLWDRAKTTLCLCAVALAQAPLPYQPTYRSQALQALQALYAMEFDRAERLFDRLDSLFGPYAGTSYLRALAYSWRIELDPSTTWFDSFWEKELKRTDSLLRCCTAHPLETYFIGFGQKALEVRRLYVRGEILPSVWKARELLSLLDGIRRYVDKYPEMEFELGLYEYYIDYFSNNYPIMRPILYCFPKGDQNSGLARLERCARDSLNYTQYEAAYFLGYIYLYQAKRPAIAVHWLQYLSRLFPSNPLFRRMWAEALYELKQYEEAQKVIKEWIESYERHCPHPPCYLITRKYPTAEAVHAYGLLGMTLREEKKYTEAQAAFYRMETLLRSLPRFPAPSWARLMREFALLEKRMGNSRAAEARLKLVQARNDVPSYLKGPLSD